MADIPAPSRSAWMPSVPAPLQRLFDQFPLATYPANELPSRSPSSDDLPALYVFVSEDDARRGRPSFNPSCLRCQTFLRFAGVRFRIVPSTNHASPTGSLPFLLPPSTSPTPSAASRLPVKPVPSSSLYSYALARARNPIQPRQSGSEQTSQNPASSSFLRQKAYDSLLNGPIRAAWLHALYLVPANRPLLRSLYVDPTTTSALVRSTLEHRLRHAAAAEVLRTIFPASSSPSSAPSSSFSSLSSLLSFSFSSSAPYPWQAALPLAETDRLYADAAAAFDALAVLLAGSATGWFFGAESPGEFDATVFSYTQLLLGSTLDWADSRLAELARRAGDGELAAHRARIWDQFWKEDVEG